MNSHCDVCDIEKDCGYRYKPTDCCDYLKFTPIVALMKVVHNSKINNNNKS